MAWTSQRKFLLELPTSFRSLYLDHPPVKSTVFMLVTIRLRLQVIKKKEASVSENSCPKRSNILVDI